jgi:hypothetical protein
MTKTKTMTLMELLDELRQRGVTLSRNPVNDKLVVSPASAVQDLIPHIERHRTGLWESVTFARSGQILLIDSKILQCRFWLAADNAIIPPDPDPRPWLHQGLVVYRATDMERLFAQAPDIRENVPVDGLRLIHAALYEFGGTVDTHAPREEFVFRSKPQSRLLQPTGGI